MGLCLYIILKTMLCPIKVNMEDSPDFRVQVKYPHSAFFLDVYHFSKVCTNLFFPANARAQTVLNIMYEKKI